jgi:hypothetical protein
MKYLKSFSDINSKIKKVTYKKYINKKNWGEIEVFFENGKKIRIIPEGDCCSISYITKFTGLPFSKLVGKKIKSLKEIKNKKKINSLYKNVKPITFSDIHNKEVNTYHLYEIKFTDNKLFNFGLINASNGFYDGWISIIEE